MRTNLNYHFRLMEVLAEKRRRVAAQGAIGDWGVLG